MSGEESFRSIFAPAAIGLAQSDVQTHRFAMVNHRSRKVYALVVSRYINGMSASAAKLSPPR